VHRDFQACAGAGNFPSEKCARIRDSRVKIKFVRAGPRAGRAVFRGKTAARGIFRRKNPPREARATLSTKKVTENFQNRPLIYLTGLGAVSISCGQGSGHPHPVVVDNVSGSFGNLASPGSSCRL
jgi:hypothetical protein